MKKPIRRFFCLRRDLPRKPSHALLSGFKPEFFDDPRPADRLFYFVLGIDGETIYNISVRI